MLLMGLRRLAGSASISWSQYIPQLARLRDTQAPPSHTCRSRAYSSVEFEKVRQHLCNLVAQHSLLLERVSDGDHVRGTDVEHETIYRTLSSLEPVVQLAKQLEEKEKELEELKLLSQQKHSELEELANEERQLCQAEIERLETSLVDALIPRDKADEHSAVLEVRAGAGGQEAALFSAEIFQMYQRYTTFKGWAFELLSQDVTDKGGLKYASAGISGVGVFGCLKHESGVHRVQRVPQTEASGRIHTSTMSVVILPQPTQVDVDINAADLKVETLRASGAGGQHVNTTDSAVRLTHIPTGIVVHIQDERSQHKNRAKAMKILRARLYEKQRVEAQRERSEQRTLQIAGGERSEKIRTYNFPQDRVSDHRLGTSFHGVTEMMTGESLFNELVQSLCLREKTNAIAALSSRS